MSDPTDTRMYGCTAAEHEAGVKDYLDKGFSRQPAQMLAISILSDVQEIIAHAENNRDITQLLERARQYLNRAKAVISDHLVHKDPFIKQIQDALGTAEEGDALVEVARNAHTAEQAGARGLRLLDDLIEAMPDADMDVHKPEYVNLWESAHDYKATK